MIVFNFFTPYIRVLYGASYNVQVVLEGLGFSSSNFITTSKTGVITGSYFSVSEAVIIPFLLLLTYSLFLSCILLIAGYTIGKLKGLCSVLVLLALPGLLNLVGYWPKIRYMPDSFPLFGGGDVGSVSGFLPLVFIGLLTGWSVVVIIYDNLNLNDKFRNLFDHFWYLSAILAGAFFIIDSGVNTSIASLKEENITTRKASSYLLNQVQRLDEYCFSHKLTETLSCQWASDVQQQLSDYSEYNENIFYKIGPKSTGELYAIYSNKYSSSDILELRKELSMYNENLCPIIDYKNGNKKHSKSSGICQRVPSTFCKSFPESPEYIANKYISVHTVAIASECIIPSIVRSLHRQEKLALKVKEGTQKKYLKWLYFVIFSFVVGGKIANATTKVMSFDNRLIGDRRRVIRLIWKSIIWLPTVIKNNFSRSFLWGILLNIKYYSMLCEKMTNNTP